MAIRLTRAVAPAGAIEAVVFRGLVAANLPVGWCDCPAKGRLYGVDITPGPRSRRAWWVTVRCDRCAREAAMLSPLAEHTEAAAA